MNYSEAPAGGYKEVIAMVTGQGAFSRFKYERGVHRVQRVPVTESQGRIHTSAAGVLVMPDVEADEVEINDDDLRIDVYRSSGPGGQGVNTTDSRVQLSLDLSSATPFTDAQRARLLRRLGARLSGGVLTVESSEERSQFRNRAAARERMASVLRAALAPPPPARRKTRPTRGSVERRLSAKRRRSLTKRARGRPDVE